MKCSSASSPPSPSPHAQIDYDHTGRSNERALVIFKKREDAEHAVSQFHKRTLDGAPMQVQIVEGGGGGGAERPYRGGGSSGGGGMNGGGSGGPRGRGGMNGRGG